jgi:L-alanine-DL-glutamate epimerase-like enolase superfamily enzyme
VETGFDSLIVSVESDSGLVGWGEMAPLGAFYSPAFASGARAGVAELAPGLVGTDPTQPRRVLYELDRRMRGQPYVKSALDMACWDLAAQSAGQPLCEATGGRFGETVALYQAVSRADPAAMASQAARYVGQGYRRLQVKVGGDPDQDLDRVAAVREAVGSDVVLFVDANGAWTTRDALRFLRASHGLDLTVEQPCASYEECLAVRPHCQHPMVLDESIDSLRALTRARVEGVADGVTIKLSRVGGVSRAILLRDVAVELNLPVTIEDTGGASIDTAAIVHLSLSTPEGLRTHTADFNSWVTVDNATGMDAPSAGAIAAPRRPGLRVEVLLEALGEPFFSTS